MTSEDDLRILLLGKTGAGKSASGNTILGRNAFKETSKICEIQEGYVDEKNIVALDTPGLFKASISKEQVTTEIKKCVKMFAPHVFLLVIKLGVRFTEEERKAVEWIQENFGNEALLRTIILFTHTDLLKGKTLDMYIKESHCLPKLVDSCDGRYHSFNNEDRNNQQQVTKLLQKMNALRRQHEIEHYTPEMFEKHQTKMTGKDRKKLPNFPYKFFIVLIGVLLGIQHLRNELKQKDELLKKQQQENQRLTTEHQEKEGQLQNELKQKEEHLQNEFEHMEKRLQNGFKLKEEHLQNVFKLKEEQLKKQQQENQRLAIELQQKQEQLLQQEQENQRLITELQQKQEQLLKQEQENQRLKTELQQKKEQLHKQEQETQKLTKEHKEEEDKLPKQLKEKEEQMTKKFKPKKELPEEPAKDPPKEVKSWTVIGWLWRLWRN